MHINALLKIKSNFFLLHFHELVQKKKRQKATKKGNYNKTPYVWINKFPPAKKILHNRWL